MFKYSKFCSYFCLFVYLLVSTNSTTWIVYQTGELAFGIVYNDYACKGGNCGCDTALKCLTNCCCSKVNVEGKVIAACKAEADSSCCSEEKPVEPKPESCCSSESKAGKDVCQLETTKPNLPIVFVSEADCSPDSELAFLDTASMHLVVVTERIEVAKSFVEPQWLRNNSSYLFDLSSKISKVPIS